MRPIFHYTFLGVMTILMLGLVFFWIISHSIENDRRLFAALDAHTAIEQASLCPRFATAVPSAEGWKCRITNPDGETITWSAWQ